MTTATIPELKAVESSRFSHAAYDADTFTLFLRHNPTKAEPGGPVYQYGNVGEEMADDFFHAESLGKFFNTHLFKNSAHPCSRVRELEPVEDEAQRPATVSMLPETPDDEADLKLQAIEVSTQVRALSISTSDEYATAGTELVRLRQMRKQAQLRVDLIKSPAYQTYKAALQLEKDVIAPYEQAERYLDTGMAAYRTEERRRREAAEAAENARRREAAEAEQKRRQQELEAEAKAAEAVGNHEAASDMRQQSLPLAAVRVQNAVLPRQVPAVAGIIERAPVWRWRVRPGEDHLIPRSFLEINEQAIGAAVRTQKSLTNIPGIEVWEEEAKVGVRSAR